MTRATDVTPASMHSGAFVNDTWAVGRMTINAGLRYDRYNGWLPEQDAAGGRPSARSSSQAKTVRCNRPFHVERRSRRGSASIFDLIGRRPHGAEGQLRPVLAQSGRGRSKQRQPEYAGEIGHLELERCESATSVGSPARNDPFVSPRSRARFCSIPTSRRRIRTKPASGSSGNSVDVMGVRAGFVYKTEDDLIKPTSPVAGPTYTPSRCPFDFVDIGLDGVRGTCRRSTIRDVWPADSAMRHPFPTTRSS